MSVALTQSDLLYQSIVAAGVLRPPGWTPDTGGAVLALDQATYDALAASGMGATLPSSSAAIGGGVPGVPPPPVVPIPSTTPPPPPPPAGTPPPAQVPGYPPGYVAGTGPDGEATIHFDPSASAAGTVYPPYPPCEGTAPPPLLTPPPSYAPACLDCCLVSDSCRSGYVDAVNTGQSDLAAAIEGLASVLASLEASISANLTAGANCASQCASMVEGAVSCDCSAAADVASDVATKVVMGILATISSASQLSAQAEWNLMQSQGGAAAQGGAGTEGTAGPGGATGSGLPFVFAPTIEVTPNVSVEVVPVGSPLDSSPPDTTAGTVSTGAGAAAAAAAGASAGVQLSVSAWVSAWAEVSAAAASGGCNVSPAAASLLVQVSAMLAGSGGPNSIPAAAAAQGYPAYLTQSQQLAVNCSLAAWAEAFAAAFAVAAARLMTQAGLLVVQRPGTSGPDLTTDRGQLGPPQREMIKQPSPYGGLDVPDYELEYRGAEEDAFGQ